MAKTKYHQRQVVRSSMGCVKRSRAQRYTTSIALCMIVRDEESQHSQDTVIKTTKESILGQANTANRHFKNNIAQEQSQGTDTDEGAWALMVDSATKIDKMDDSSDAFSGRSRKRRNGSHIQSESSNLESNSNPSKKRRGGNQAVNGQRKKETKQESSRAVRQSSTLSARSSSKPMETETNASTSPSSSPRKNQSSSVFNKLFETLRELTLEEFVMDRVKTRSGKRQLQTEPWMDDFADERPATKSTVKEFPVTRSESQQRRNQPKRKIRDESIDGLSGGRDEKESDKAVDSEMTAPISNVSKRVKEAAAKMTTVERQSSQGQKGKGSTVNATNKNKDDVTESTLSNGVQINRESGTNILSKLPGITSRIARRISSTTTIRPTSQTKVTAKPSSEKSASKLTDGEVDVTDDGVSRDDDVDAQTEQRGTDDGERRNSEKVKEKAKEKTGKRRDGISTGADNDTERDGDHEVKNKETGMDKEKPKEKEKSKQPDPSASTRFSTRTCNPQPSESIRYAPNDSQTSDRQSTLKRKRGGSYDSDKPGLTIAAAMALVPPPEYIPEKMAASIPPLVGFSAMEPYGPSSYSAQTTKQSALPLSSTSPWAISPLSSIASSSIYPASSRGSTAEPLYPIDSISSSSSTYFQQPRSRSFLPSAGFHTRESIHLPPTPSSSSRSTPPSCAFTDEASTSPQLSHLQPPQQEHQAPKFQTVLESQRVDFETLERVLLPIPCWLPWELEGLKRGLDKVGKAFSVISRDYIPSKSTAECIEAYYMYKHTLLNQKPKQIVPELGGGGNDDGGSGNVQVEKKGGGVTTRQGKGENGKKRGRK
ncbi:hypothetical protein HDU76_005088 [Blyttiomyces sp. JEL0837]|nr:hypothetical protein HDU76_005088 [Blyttiomyces sp. JEL0837]